MEAMIAAADRAVSLNFTTIAQVTGPLTEAALRKGLDAATARHALVRSRIDGLSFAPSAEPVPLRICDAAAWEPELELEINTRVAATDGPLARAVWVRHADGEGTLMLTLHHAIGDGMSGVYLMRDVLSATGRALDTEPADLPVLPLPPGINTLMPATARGLAGFWRRFKFLARDLWATVRYGLPLQLRHDRVVRARDRKMRIIPVVLEPEETTRLATRARAERTTVHGALAAAIMTAMAADSDSSKTRRMNFGTPVNLRKTLVPAAGEEVAFRVSMLAYAGAVSASTDPWQLARDVKAGLVRQVDDGTAPCVLGVLTGIFGLLGGRRITPEKLAVRWPKALPTTGGLTNLGRLDVPTQFGALRMDSCHFAASPSVLGDFVTTATSLHGRLFWNFVWPDPALASEHAQALVDDILRRLRAAVDS